MDELFRILTVRAPGQNRDPNVVTIMSPSFTASADLPGQLTAFLDGRDAENLDPVEIGPLAASVKEVFAKVLGNPSTDLADLTADIAASFGLTPVEVVQLGDFKTLRDTVDDYVVALLIAA